MSRAEDGLAVTLICAAVLAGLGSRFAGIPDFSGSAMLLVCLLVGFAAPVWAFIRLVRDKQPIGAGSLAILGPLDPADRVLTTPES